MNQKKLNSWLRKERFFAHIQRSDDGQMLIIHPFMMLLVCEQDLIQEHRPEETGLFCFKDERLVPETEKPGLVELWGHGASEATTGALALTDQVDCDEGLVFQGLVGGAGCQHWLMKTLLGILPADCQYEMLSWNCIRAMHQGHMVALFRERIKRK